MKNYLKALLASAFALTLAGAASAHGNVRIYAAPPYYPPAEQVQPRYYVSPPVYYGPHDEYVTPSWEERRAWRMHREQEWRRAEWQRREEWRRQQWRREHWQREQWQREQWRDGRRNWDGRD